jgi:hypothetical protein
MKVFGPEPWGPAVDEPSMYAGPLVSTDVICHHCKEPILVTESGVVMSLLSLDGAELIAQHRECHLRQVFGSVGHQLGKCSCRGGSEDDPPGLTTRDAALAAVNLFYSNLERPQ